MKSGTVIVLLVFGAPSAWAVATLVAPADPHGDPNNGVLRVLTEPSSRGECQQCHPAHADWAESPSPPDLFTENTNNLAFWGEGAAPCHAARPDNYPLQEWDRMPDSESDAGYFEANSAGTRRTGVELRGRWPGEAVFTDPAVTPSGRFISPHAYDPDMPRKDAGGQALCLNCHDPHEGVGQRDLLVAEYGGIGGSGSSGPPAEYRLCLACHGSDGPIGMDPENQFIEDYYDRSLNGELAGHQIRKNPAVAISWPAHIQVGDMLPCYDCHGAHGSRGANGAEPNGYLLSDQRSAWSGLTETLTSAEQSRRFCLGCHIASDGVPGAQTVEGIVMNTLSAEAAHASGATESCHDCHGRDYTSPVGRNVHNPSRGDE